jgi:hypothetical protein
LQVSKLQLCRPIASAHSAITRLPKWLFLRRGPSEMSLRLHDRTGPRKGPFKGKLGVGAFEQLFGRN